MSNSETSNRPSHIIYQVIDGPEVNGEKKSYWNRVGAGWKHKTGTGLNLKFDAFPLTGRISIQDAKDKPEGESSDSAPRPSGPRP